MDELELIYLIGLLITGILITGAIVIWLRTSSKADINSWPVAITPFLVVFWPLALCLGVVLLGIFLIFLGVQNIRKDGKL